jgi:abnormal spindle-like microcephaly-associated protein
MKDGYTMLTDVALKEKFIQTMLSYNTPWLKMGLHIVLGHGAFLAPDKVECQMDYSNQQDAEEERETESTILRWVIEKHFLAHPGLAKHHATNKSVLL